MDLKAVFSLNVLLCLSAAAAAAPFTSQQGTGGSKSKSAEYFSRNFAIPFLFLLVVCEPFADPENGRVSHMVNKGATHIAVFSCDDGYAVIGKNTITCNDGAWERDALQCTGICNTVCLILHNTHLLPCILSTIQLLIVELLKVLKMDKWSILTQHTNPRPNTPVIHATL